MAKRNQIRSLLLPGIAQRGAQRGVHFTNEEIERIVDAFLAAPAGDEVKAAIRHMDLLARWPADFRAEATRTAQHLATLKSVSKAYRKSAVHAIQARGAAYLQQQKDQQAHDDRKAAQDLARRAAQPLAAGGLIQGALPGQAIPIPGARIGLVGIGAFMPAGVNYGGFGRLGAGQLGSGTEQAPRPELPKQVKAGEIVGWRAWMIHATPQGYRLSSVAANAQWYPGQPMTGKPTPDGQAGVHAWKSRQQAEDYARGGDHVVGQVELWGKVIEHDLGYRAEFGAIKSLDALELMHPSGASGIYGSAASVLRDLQTAYGVPVGGGTARTTTPLPPMVFGPTGRPINLPKKPDFARANMSAIWGIILGCLLVGVCGALASKMDRRAAAYSQEPRIVDCAVYPCNGAPNLRCGGC